MPSIQDFEDYREFLLEVYEWKKRRNPRYSYRMMALRIGIDPARLHKVLHGRGFFVRGTALRIAQSLGLDEAQTRELQFRIDLVGAPGNRASIGFPPIPHALAS